MQKIPVPYPVPCLEPNKVPQLPTPVSIDLDKASQAQVVSAMAADLLALEKYALQADPLLRQCAVLVKEVPAPKP